MSPASNRPSLSQKLASHPGLLPSTTLAACLIWHFITFFKIPHLNWIPGFLDTWFSYKGLTYFKDFIQPHFPFSHLVMYPFLRLTHWHLETDPSLALAIAIITTITLFYLGKKTLSPIGLSAALIFYSLFLWYFCTWVQFSQEMLLGLFLLPLPFLLTRFSHTLPSSKTVFFTGMFFSFIELTGQLITPTLVVTFFILIYTLWGNQKHPKTILKYISSFLLGASLPFGITSAYLISQNAFSDFFYWNLPYYLNYSKLNTSHPTILPWKDIVTLYSPLLPLLVLIIHQLRHKKTSLFANTLFLLSLSTIPPVIFSVFHPHHFLVALPLLALCLGLTLTSLPTAPFSAKILALFTILFLLFFTTTTLLPWHFNKMKPGWHITNLNQIAPSSPESAMLNWLNQNSKTDSRIIIAADPIFYFLSNRLPANNRFSVIPWHYLPLEKTKSTFASSPPQFWLINQNYLRRLQYDWGTPEIADFIKIQLENCYSRTFSQNGWEIWQRTCSLPTK